ncbi:MAG: O-methyltransferase [Candidatus Altimarinota bacterium]
MKLFAENLENLLEEMEKQREQYWNIPREAAELIYFLGKVIKAEKILEIGTSSGYSGIWLANIVKPRDGKVYTVESHPGRFALAAENFEKAGVGELIVQVKGHAPQVLREVPEIMEGGFDLVFLDATKREHVAYFKEIAALLKVGGMVIADNILSHEEKMLEYVDYLRSSTDFNSEIVPIGTGLLISLKK